MTTAATQLLPTTSVLRPYVGGTVSILGDGEEKQGISTQRTPAVHL